MDIFFLGCFWLQNSAIRLPFTEHISGAQVTYSLALTENWECRQIGGARFSATDSLGHSFPLRWPLFYSCQTQLQVRLLLSIYQHTANGLHYYKGRQVSKKKKGWVDLLYDDESRYLYVLLLFWNMLRSCKSLFNTPATMVFWGKFPWIVRTSAVTQTFTWDKTVNASRLILACVFCPIAPTGFHQSIFIF